MFLVTAARDVIGEDPASQGGQIEAGEIGLARFRLPQFPGQLRAFLGDDLEIERDLVGSAVDSQPQHDLLGFLDEHQFPREKVLHVH